MGEFWGKPFGDDRVGLGSGQIREWVVDSEWMCGRGDCLFGKTTLQEHVYQRGLTL